MEMLVILVQCLNTLLLALVLVYDVGQDQKSMQLKLDVLLVYQDFIPEITQLVFLVRLDISLPDQELLNVFDVDVENNQTLLKPIVNIVFPEHFLRMKGFVNNVHRMKWLMMELVNVMLVVQVRNLIVCKLLVFLVQQEVFLMEMVCVFLVRLDRILLM